MNERELQTRAKNGDFEAFNELVKMHSDRIYRLAVIAGPKLYHLPRVNNMTIASRIL